MAISKELRDGLLLVLVVNVVIAAIIYAWMAFFVLLLEYDYVTSSSILFTLFLALVLLTNLNTFIRIVREREFAEGLGTVIGMLLVLASLTGGLGVFTSLHHPDISDRFDMVGSFWGTIGLPFVLLVKAVGALLVGLLTFASKGFPVVSEALKNGLYLVEHSPTFSNALGGLLSATLTALLFRSRLLPVKAA